MNHTLWDKFCLITARLSKAIIIHLSKIKEAKDNQGKDFMSIFSHLINPSLMFSHIILRHIFLIGSSKRKITHVHVYAVLLKE